MQHWPEQTPLEAMRGENEIRPMRYKKARLKNMFRLEEFRERWAELKYLVYQRRRGSTP